MNDFEQFDKWVLLIIALIFFLMIVILGFYAHSLNEFIEAVRELK